MLGPHNYDKLPNLSYIFSYFCDPYNEKLQNDWRIHTERMFKGMVRS
jgi:hypothetical protein